MALSIQQWVLKIVTPYNGGFRRVGIQYVLYVCTRPFGLG
jgi:hypothetical protein